MQGLEGFVFEAHDVPVGWVEGVEDVVEEGEDVVKEGEDVVQGFDDVVKDAVEDVEDVVDGRLAGGGGGWKTS